MENYIQDIELINTHLNKKLSESEIQDFENRLKADSDFNALFDAHITFLEGLKRQQLKAEIKKAKQSYLKAKWMKFLGVSMLVLMVAAVVYVIISNKSIKPIQNSNPENTSTVMDTIASEKTIETSINSIEPIILRDSISSKNEVTKGDLLKPIKTVETSFKKTSQTFKLSTQKDTVLICKEGTKVSFRANSFVDNKGKPINGAIDLNVTEYYKLSDMLFANLSTTSNGKQLETGGMLFIEAKKDGTKLMLEEKASIEISFPTVDKKRGMQLFSGEWKNGVIDWKLQESRVEETVTGKVEAGEVEGDVQVPFAVVEQAPIYPGCENLDNAAGKTCTSAAINRFVQSNFNTEIARDLGLTGRQRINVLFKINQSGHVVDIRTRASHPDLEDEVYRVLSLLPTMKPAKQRGNKVSVPYSLPIIFQVEDEREFSANIVGDLRVRKKIQDSINTKRFEDRLTGKDSVTVSSSDVNNYILRASNLGWINCDRFIRTNQKIKYKLKIDNDGGAKVNMIFRSFNSILPSHRTGDVFDFDRVPKNEEIILIVTKKDRGKLYLDIVETTTEENPNIEFHFKEVTIAELKEQLKTLDYLFD